MGALVLVASLGGLVLLLLGLALLFGQMSIAVGGRRLSVRYGCAKWLGRDVPLDDIESCEVVSYRLIRDFGGWGIRCARRDGEWTVCYTFRGTRAVLLRLRAPIRFGTVEATRLLIGSDAPERLRQALDMRVLEEETLR